MKGEVIIWREAEKCGFPAPKKYHFVLTKLMVIEESNNMSSITKRSVLWISFRLFYWKSLIFLGKQVFITHFINFGTAKNPVGLKLDSKNSKNPADKYFLQNNRDGKCSNIGKHSVAAIWNKTFLDKLLSIELTKSFWEFLMLHIKKCLGHSPQRLLFQYYIKGWIWFWYGAPSSMHIFEPSFCVYFFTFFWLTKYRMVLSTAGPFFDWERFRVTIQVSLKGAWRRWKYLHRNP